MGKFSIFAGLAAAALILVSCGGSTASQALSPEDVKDSYQVKGVSLSFVKIEGGSVSMGTMADGRHISGSNVHQTVLDGYAISPLPVSQAIWQAVMGGSGGSASVPMGGVSYKDIRKFLAKLSKHCGVPFSLPTEAQWELAEKQGLITLVDGCREWVADTWSDEDAIPVCKNYVCVAEGSDKVVRTASRREPLADYTKGGTLTFRVAVAAGPECPEEVLRVYLEQQPLRENSCRSEKITVGDAVFDMVAVKGGSFLMGATDEQAEYGDDNEKPVSHMTVDGFEMGRTEVTVAQWQAVMGSVPLGNDEKKGAGKPVINVSWYAAQDFILRLNALTGRKFRLPTEAEWEYAARGGTKSYGYRFSGSNQVYAVAAYVQNTDGKVTDVASHSPNELGLYDMSGNAWEWCQDYYYEYGTDPQPSEWHVQRGGSAASSWKACRVSNRQKIPAISTKGTFGFRLAI